MHLILSMTGFGRAETQNDEVILAVGHNSFKELSFKQWEKIIENKGIVMDVKNIAPRASCEP